jgi:hypothetical protein
MEASVSFGIEIEQSEPHKKKRGTLINLLINVPRVTVVANAC